MSKDNGSLNPPLKEFIQDVANGAVYIAKPMETGFMKVVLSKLKDVTRESVRDKRYNPVNDLMAHLKNVLPLRKSISGKL